MRAPVGTPGLDSYIENRFHILAVVFQRVHQLRAGARPRVPAEDHKPTRLALLEVMADAVSWSFAEPEPDDAAAPAAPPVSV